ncbi:hypothetical protein LCGC14_2988370 [marine sediment metagenome]|uniref:Uncharacterized protein n=1 Tax=marine sediment metagenome TaxID=412755 RepID=A0A0F8ZVL7_9ZZZZ
MKIKTLFLALFLSLAPSIVQAEMKHRVWYMPDGTVRITIPADSACSKNESQASCEKRIFEETGNEIPELKAVLSSGDYEDIDPVLKPDRADREYWRGSKATGIRIDAAAKNAGNQERLKRQADKQSAKDKLKTLGLTDSEIESLLER